jgi:hypothetical protein
MPGGDVVDWAGGLSPRARRRTHILTRPPSFHFRDQLLDSNGKLRQVFLDYVPGRLDVGSLIFVAE